MVYVQICSEVYIHSLKSKSWLWKLYNFASHWYLCIRRRPIDIYLLWLICCDPSPLIHLWVSSSHHSSLFIHLWSSIPIQSQLISYNILSPHGVCVLPSISGRNPLQLPSSLLVILSWLWFISGCDLSVSMIQHQPSSISICNVVCSSLSFPSAA